MKLKMFLGKILLGKGESQWSLVTLLLNTMCDTMHCGHGGGGVAGWQQ